MVVYIILVAAVAFIFGVAVGIRYMYDKYNQQMLDNLKTLEELKLGDAKLRGMLDALKIVRGIKDTTPPDIRDGSSYFLTPDDEEVTLAECPVGLFAYDGTLGMKTEYVTANGDGKYKIDAYIVSTGERFCISNGTLVKPCGVWIADGDEDE
jgi:hypothetical protein